MESLAYLIMLLVGSLVGMAATMLLSMREWTRLDSKITQLRQEKKELCTALEKLQIEKNFSGVQFEEN